MNGDIRRTLHQAVLSRLDARKTGMSFSEDVGRWRDRAEEYLQAEMCGLSLGDAERDALRQEILDEIFAFGPITPLLSDPAVSEIMVNGYESIYVERSGLVSRHGGSFLSEESLRATIDRMVSKVNRRLDESSPYVDARLPDGSRINAIIPPVCLTGACLTVRKFRKEAFSLEELVRIGSVAEDAAEYLRGGRSGAAQRHRLRWDRLREDHPAERPVPVHPGGRADRHDRGCGGDPASEAPRDPPRGETGQHRRIGRRHDPGPRPQLPSHAPRPDHRRGVPRGGGARHAAGDEHRP